MSYIETQPRQTQITTTVYTIVKFDFSEEEFWIAHVNPPSEEYILDSISKREASERARFEAEQL